MRRLIKTIILCGMLGVVLYGVASKSVSARVEIDAIVFDKPASKFSETTKLLTDRYDLTPTEGDFLAYGEYDDVVEDSNGDFYGYPEDFFGGCSVWCAIQDYSVVAEASSFLSPQGIHTYMAENIIDQNRDTAWVEGVIGDGIGESITIKKFFSNGSGDNFYFENICIVNGIARNANVWRKNGRVKTLRMYFNDEYVCDLDLLDTMKPQYISLLGLNIAAKNNSESIFRFEIADVYKGEVYEDTALTGIEIQVYTLNH